MVLQTHSFLLSINTTVLRPQGPIFYTMRVSRNIICEQGDFLKRLKINNYDGKSSSLYIFMYFFSTF